MGKTDSASSPSRVVLVSPQAHYAGHYWRDTYTLANALAATGTEVEAIVATDPIGGENIFRTLHHCLPPWWRWLTDRLTQHGQLEEVMKLFNHLETLLCALRALPAAVSRAEVVHFLGGTHILIFLFALLGKRPVFLSIYGDFWPPSGPTPSLKYRLRKWLLDQVMQRNKLVVICEIDSLRDRWRWCLGDRIVTIPYAVTVAGQRETKAEARATLGLPRELPILLLFGTQREGKDYGVVLRAAAQLKSQVHLLFVGKTISQNNPQRLAEELGFKQATFIDRFVDETEVPCFFFAADAAVLPYAEGFDRGSGVILDACAYGRPIIASRTGYLQWFVETHQAGFLYRPGDADELAAVIRQLITLGEAERMALEDRVAKTAQLHSWPEVVKTYLQVYRRYGR